MSSLLRIALPYISIALVVTKAGFEIGTNAGVSRASMIAKPRDDHTLYSFSSTRESLERGARHSFLARSGKRGKAVHQMPPQRTGVPPAGPQAGPSCSACIYLRLKGLNLLLRGSGTLATNAGETPANPGNGTFSGPTINTS